MSFTPSEYVSPVPPHLLLLLQVSMSQLIWEYLFSFILKDNFASMEYFVDTIGI